MSDSGDATTPPGVPRVDRRLALLLAGTGGGAPLTVVITVQHATDAPVDPESTRAQVDAAVTAARLASGLRPVRLQVLAYLARAVIGAAPEFLRALLRQPQITAMALTEPPR